MSNEIIDNKFLENISNYFKNNKFNILSNDIFNKFCNYNENNVFIDYKIFKHIYNDESKNIIMNYISNILKKILLNYDIFNVHICFKSLNVSQIEKVYSFISYSCDYFKNEFPNKLQKCYVYDAPEIFTFIFNIISGFIDKDTQKKIQLFTPLKI